MVGLMIVTIDCDGGRISLLWKIFKGLLICRRFPDEIYRTLKGYHLIWYGLKIDFKKHFLYRKFIGDDLNRIKLDMNPKRIGQVLFTDKKVWIKRKNWEAVRTCSICKKYLTWCWVVKNGEYYCLDCGKKNTNLWKRVYERRERLFNSLLSRISDFRKLYKD